MCQIMVATFGPCSPSWVCCSWRSALRCWALWMTRHMRRVLIYKKAVSTLSVTGCVLCLFVQKLREATSGRLTGFCATKWQQEKGSLNCIPGGVETLKKKMVKTKFRIIDHVWMKMSKWLWIQDFQDSSRAPPFCRP